MNFTEAFDATSDSDLDSTAEHRLMAAVLEEALATFRLGVDSGSPERRKRYFEVSRWFASRDCEWLYSFESICASLGIDSDYMRAGLRKLERATRMKKNLAPSLVPAAAIRRTYRARA
ncbi:MAG TPA: hypothetical protein VEC57_02245 [Candidatus Limnocylindrales bacterium]|nr:hypothetical protein [Candidatus Limnocylindrales bacterium]